jgi:hypothetical protein
MLAHLTVAVLVVWLIAELVPMAADALASLERRPPLGREDD